MTDRHDDAARDLVQRAHQTDPEHVRFDTAAGLADVLSRVSQSATGDVPGIEREAQVQLIAERVLQEPEQQPRHIERTGTSDTLIRVTSRELLTNAPRHGREKEGFAGSVRAGLAGKYDHTDKFPTSPGIYGLSEGQSLASETDEALVEAGSLVRPYTMTGGRTRADYDLSIEALVSTSDNSRELVEPLLPEHRVICDLCMDTKSVAEVAAHLRLPLGVARVLIGDMVGMGLVLIHNSGTVTGDRPSIEFMERVLKGLRRL